MGVGIAPFLEALRKSGFEPFFFSDFVQTAKTAVSQIRSAFRSVDLVIVLLVHGRALENVFFEMGIALGMARPIIIFADPGVELPIGLSGIRLHRTDLTDLADLVPTVEKFTNTKAPSDAHARVGSAGSVSSSLAPDRGPSREKLNAAIAAIRNAQAHGVGVTSIHLERLITELFKSADLRVVEAPQQVRRRVRVPDLAVWIDDVQKEIGNPIAVEIKASLYENALDDVTSQLTASLRSVDAKAGILIHTNSNIRRAHNLFQTSPLIFIFTIDELLNVVENSSLSTALKNSLHAVPYRTR
jgi:hypothetical protein